MYNPVNSHNEICQVIDKKVNNILYKILLIKNCIYYKDSLQDNNF